MNDEPSRLRCIGSNMSCIVLEYNLHFRHTVLSGPTREDVRTSPPAANESMSIAKREVVRLGSLRDE